MDLYRRGGKRLFDLVSAVAGLVMLSWLLIMAVAVASFDTKSFGVFRQIRIGRHGQPFSIYKVKTMRDEQGTVLTTKSDKRITRVGGWLRKYKIDEIPQLINVLAGHMSFVGPRPEVPEYASIIMDNAPEILDLRPGITGPATLKYRYEEELLDNVVCIKTYNDHVIFPDKIRINQRYSIEYTVWSDLRYILRTLRLL